MSKKKILVLGGTGFIGTHLIEALLKKNYKVNVLIHKSGLGFQHKNLRMFKGDVQDKNSLKNAFEGVSTVVNLVGQVTSPDKYYALNSVGILNVLDKCVENNVEKIVFTSSVKVYGSSSDKCTEERVLEPVSREGIMKLVAENLHRHYSKNYNIPVTCLRLSNVYGPRQKKGVLFNFVHDALKKGVVVINGDGEQERSFVYVSDVVSAIISAIEQKSRGYEVFNISSGEAITINKVLEIIKKNLGKEVNVQYRELPKVEEKFSRVDYSKAKRILGYEPEVSLEKGIYITCKALEEEIT